MNRTVFRLIATVLGGLTLSAAAQEPRATDAAANGFHWHARLAIGTIDGSLRPSAVSLLGDHHVHGLRLGKTGASGGFRATSGLILGAWSSLGHPGAGNGMGHSEPGDPGATQPYLGLGFTRIASGLSFSADLGLLARFGPAAGGARPVLGTQGLDAAVRQLKLSPVLQLGVRYSF